MTTLTTATLIAPRASRRVRRRYPLLDVPHGGDRRPLGLRPVFYQPQRTRIHHRVDVAVEEKRDGVSVHPRRLRRQNPVRRGPVPPVRPAQEHVPDVGEYGARHGIRGHPNRSRAFAFVAVAVVAVLPIPPIRANLQAADVVLDEERERAPVRVRAASRAVADVRIDRAFLLPSRVSKQTELGERVVDVFFEAIGFEAERDGEAPHERRRDDAAVGVVSRDRLLEPVETDRPLGVQSPAVARHVARNVRFLLVPAALAVDAFSELEHLTESSLVQLLRPGRFVPRALAASRPERHLRRVRQREQSLRGSQRSVD
mmetsp:Transcript_8643/g.39265  ORF Transcript_8643/g.39265 Transcript_8643/m.39265 type:complete len:314 (-) Transcript_8643:192-1133(-)